MNNGWKPVLWGAAALLLLLAIPTPLNALTLFLLMTPFVLLFLSLRPAAFAAYIVAIGIGAYLLSGPYGPLAVTIMVFFLVPSIIMGYMYRRRKKARSVILMAFCVILAQLLLELVLFSLQFKIDLAAELTALLQTSLLQFESDGLMPAGWAADTASQLGEAIVEMLPLLILLSSFLFAVVTHGITRALMRRSGIELPGLPAMKTWMLPRSVVWYYAIAVVLSFVIPEKGSGFMTLVEANLIPVLRYAFMVQAIGFFFYLADVKQWSRVVPILIAVPVILFPPLYLIGLLDAAFPLRRYFAKS